MSRRLSQLSELGWLFVIVACSATPAGSGPPPGSSEGGSTDQSGGTTSINSSAGGAPTSTGGSPSITDGGAPATGGAQPGVGGSVGATGGSPSTTPAVRVTMAMSDISADGLQGVLTVTLPSGAASIPMSTLRLQLCGHGGSGLVQGSSLHIYDGRLTCPQVQSTECPQGQSIGFQSQVKITVTGLAPSCCLNFDFTSVPNSLAVGGNLRLQYAMVVTDGETLNHSFDQVWSATVSGQLAAGSCTVPAWPATTATCS